MRRVRALQIQRLEGSLIESYGFEWGLGGMTSQPAPCLWATVSVLTRQGLCVAQPGLVAAYLGSGGVQHRDAWFGGKEWQSRDGGLGP
jgi:hypothetical protein